MLEELLELRERECRLVPELALQTLDEAETFLHDRGLLTRNPSLSLPSLFGACHEEPYKPGSGGFGEWPSTKWPWSFELARRPGVVAPKIHLGKTLYLSPAAATLADPIIRAELDRCGIPLVHETRWTMYVRDPEGNRVALSHHPDG